MDSTRTVVEATGGRYWVPQETRIVASLTVKANDGSKLPKPVRFACDPVGAGMLSAGMMTLNGTVVSSVAAKRVGRGRPTRCETNRTASKTTHAAGGVC